MKKNDYREPLKEIPLKRQVTNVRARIWRILKDAGAWDSTLSYQVELAASDIVVWRKLRDDVLSLDSLITTIERDNGSMAPKAHPLLNEYREQAKIVQKDCDLLLMNIKSKKGKDVAADGLKEFMARMAEA